MKTTTWLMKAAIGLVLGVAALPARAEDGARARELRPALAASVLAIRLELPASSRLLEDVSLDLSQRFVLRLPAPSAAPTSGMRLELPVLSFGLVYVSADLSGELPRPSAIDGETYFTPGLQVHLPAGLAAFVEDFQPASGVIGGRDARLRVARHMWDGHQVAFGLRWSPSATVLVEAAGVAHVLSDSGRDPHLGALASVRLTYCRAARPARRPDGAARA
jgi:hypothetical protein